MNAKHTPGPWVVYSKPHDHWMPQVIVATSAGCEEKVATAEPVGSTPERHQNARLIAAAPDLLAALIDTLAIARIKWGNLDTDASAVMDRAGKAITKALGPQ